MKTTSQQRLEIVDRAHARAIQAHGKAIATLAAALMAKSESTDADAIKREIRDQAEQVLTFVSSA